ncbi:MAG: NAD(P)H-dependent oxidoreductase [Gammaproteobacteria bacterium]|nr:NAD(P)H-dependent oxidoreductase [Gammaproteobacteria bacterium]MDE0410981.1 NAD(P)H-dependent oxidoreductase [Gammaproteobacteria bacterium]
MKLLGVSGGLSRKTLIAIKKALDSAKRYDSTVETEAISLNEYDIQFCDARAPDKYEGDARLVIDKFVEADALLLGTPMYRGTYTGLLKNMFDLIPNDALLGKPVGMIATGGSDHHYLALEHEMKPLLGFFYVHVIPGSVYANNSHYSESDLVDEGVLEQLDQLGRAIVNFARIIPDDKLSIVGPLGPSIQRKSLKKPG